MTTSTPNNSGGRGNAPTLSKYGQQRLVDGEQDLTAFSSALDTPTDLTAPARLNLLALASNAWRSDPDGFATAVNAQVANWASTVSKVAIVDSSSLTLLGDRELGRRMGAEARAFVERELSLTRMVRRHDELYRRVVRGE